MSENHTLETILTGIGTEPVPQDVHRLAESIVDEFRRGLSAGPDTAPPESHDTESASQGGDDLAISQDSVQPAVRPDAHVPTELADGVLREAHPIEQPPSRRHVRRRFVAMFQPKTVRWLIAGAIAAAVVLAIGLWPGKTGRDSRNGVAWANGVVWADVIRQMQMAQTAHLRITSRESHIAGGKEVVLDVHLKAPDKTRVEWPASIVGKDAVAITNGNRLLKLYPSEKQCIISTTEPIPVDQIFAQYCLFPDGATAPEQVRRPALLGAGSGRLIPQGPQERNGRKLNKYLLEIADRPAPADAVESGQTYCWLDPSSNEVVLITLERVVDGKSVETSCVEVRLNVPVPDKFFSTEVPPGYSLSSPIADVPGVTAGMSDVATKYEQARNGIRRYRLMMWEPGETNQDYYTAVRCVCDGDRWRVDRVRRTLVAIESEFEPVWKELVVGSYGNSGLTYLGRPATIRRLSSGVRSEWGEDPNLSRYRLADLGWPALPVGNTAIAGAKRGIVYERLPDQPDRPGLIGIRTESDYEQSETQRLEVFWIDPAKDYLCVRHEEHQRKGRPWKGDINWQPTEPEMSEQPKGPVAEFDHVREIVVVAQTPEGRCYPEGLRYTTTWVVDGQRYCFKPRIDRIRVETTVPIPQDLLEWPADVPQPQ